MNKAIYILIFLLAVTVQKAAAQYTLTAIVTDVASKSGIAKTEVFSHETGQIYLTNELGQVELAGLPSGTNYLTFFATGYNSKTDTINIDSDLQKEFELAALSYELGTLDIVAQKKEFFAIKQLKDIEGTSIFAGKKSEVVVLDLIKGNLATNNGRQIYAQVAGLNIYEGNDGGLQLNLGGRGLDPNRTSNFNTRQNGYDISADVLGYPENYYTPPSEALTAIRIVRGASSLQYGTQFGGLIDFRIRKIPSFKKLEVISTQTVSSFNAFSSYNSIGVNKGKSSINIFYNYKKGDGYRQNSEYNSHNVFGAYELKLNPKTKLSAELTYFKYLAKQAGGLTDEQFLDNPRQSTRARNWFEVDWTLYNVQLEQKIGQSSLLTINLFGLDASRKSVGFRGDPKLLNSNPITSLDEQDSNGNYILPRDLIDGRFRNYGAEIKSLNPYNIGDKKSVFLIGGKFYKSNNSSLQTAGSTGVDADFESYATSFPDYSNQSSFNFPNTNLSLFSENIFYLTDKLSLTPGVRLEYIKTESEGTYNRVVFDNAGNAIANNVLSDNRSLDRKFALLGLGLGYKKSDQLEVVANLSQNYRSVTFSDIRVVSPTFIVDPDISDEKGYTADVGIKGRFDKYLSYDLAAFSVLYDDRIGVILDRSANRVRQNIGRAVIAGTESLVVFNPVKWRKPEEQKYSGSIFINAAFTYSKYLASDENNVEGNRVEFIPIANVKAGINCSYKTLDLAYQMTYLSKQYTDVQNSERAADGDRSSGIIGPIPSYSISDLTLTYKLKNFHLKSGINNLLDRSYFTRRATGYPGPGIIPSDGRSFFVSISYQTN